jgi:2,4-dienoyl-CoA reductase-like NADH-dependent reductase (Old Yellow Enzyme family)
MYFADPKPTYAHLVTEIRDRYPDFAYLHVVEPRVDGSQTVEVIKDGYSNDFIRDIWGDRRLISAGGYTRDTAIAAAEGKGDLIAFARPYIANVSFASQMFDSHSDVVASLICHTASCMESRSPLEIARYTMPLGALTPQGTPTTRLHLL